METKVCKKCGEEKEVAQFYLCHGKPRNACKSCTKAQNNRWYSDNREAVCKRTNAYYEEHKSEYAEYNAKYRKNNPDTCRKATRRYRDKDRVSYRKRDLARVSKRRADKIQRTPAWADLKKIEEIYANRPDGYHIDHIIPLKGENVSGLHVEGNLEAIPARENLRKSNKFPHT